MTRIPWIFGFIGVVAAAVPPGRDMIEAAFFSGEALTRNIAGPIVVIGFGILAIFVVIEWSVRCMLHRRRQPAVPISKPTPPGPAPAQSSAAQPVPIPNAKPTE